MILRGHVLDRLLEIPAGSAQTVITSPPYWGQRRYGVEGEAVADWPALGFMALADGCMSWVKPWRGELGHEPEIELYVAAGRSGPRPLRRQRHHGRGRACRDAPVRRDRDRPRLRRRG